MDIEEQFALEANAIRNVERRWCLPALSGSARQRKWARIIRKQFVEELVFNMPHRIAHLSADQRLATIEVAFRLVREPWASKWIDLRGHLGSAAEFASERGAELYLDRLRRAASAAQQQEIEAFEAIHALPPLRPEGMSVAQAAYGRRCRFEMLHLLDDERLCELSPQIRSVRDAGRWIGALNRDSLSYAVDAASSTEGQR